MAENIKYINADELSIKLDAMRNPDSEFATDDYIDGFSDGISAVIKELETIPTTDVVKVVRCKDCEHFRTKPNYCGKLAVDDVEEDFYCCYGERRE